MSYANIFKDSPAIPRSNRNINWYKPLNPQTVPGKTPGKKIQIDIGMTNPYRYLYTPYDKRYPHEYILTKDPKKIGTFNKDGVLMVGELQDAPSHYSIDRETPEEVTDDWGRIRIKLYNHKPPNMAPARFYQ
jgi:hypothetical protein